MRFIIQKFAGKNINAITSTEEIDEKTFFDLVKSEAIEDAKKRGDNPTEELIQGYIEAVTNMLYKGNRVTIDDTNFLIEKE